MLPKLKPNFMTSRDPNQKSVSFRYQSAPGVKVPRPTHHRQYCIVILSGRESLTCVRVLLYVFDNIVIQTHRRKFGPDIFPGSTCRGHIVSPGAPRPPLPQGRAKGGARQVFGYVTCVFKKIINKNTYFSHYC